MKQIQANDYQNQPTFSKAQFKESQKSWIKDQPGSENFFLKKTKITDSNIQRDPQKSTEVK
ncbi:hypothetical protein [Leptospira jelokensis]|uniref:hypothetical protein n=1 Tax=Leptospira jelokensis TaxID=2484931 RepID=UPI001090C9A2|nr:hypothetical protein [Leptospira jelokensis]TGL99780.1 hypothetical protein EHQ79_18615 [Leptospira jelokensis]